jgi:uncharacterized protein (TIGR02300 family)
MTTAYKSGKSLRGTKRICHACGVRFYDLSREPIVCPSCGEHHTAEAQLSVGVPTRAERVSGKTGRRRPERLAPEPRETAREQDIDVASAGASAIDERDEVIEEIEAAPTTIHNDDIVLEQEPDDADFSNLVDHQVEKPGER